MIRHFLAAAAAAALNAVHSKGDEGQHSYYDQGRLFSGVCSSSNGGGLRPYMCRSIHAAQTIPAPSRC